MTAAAENYEEACRGSAFAGRRGSIGQGEDLEEPELGGNLVLVGRGNGKGRWTHKEDSGNDEDESEESA